MKIFTASQIRAGDAYTIKNEPVGSIDLMERAATQCVNCIQKYYSDKVSYHVFCGVGNNGGDGLAITRLLQDKGYDAHAYMVLYSENFSEDCRENRRQLEHAFGANIHAIHSLNDFPELPSNAVIVDALFGTGLNRPLEGMLAAIVNRINDCGNEIIAIDMPSGLQAEENDLQHPVIKATHTLSFEFYKLAFLFSENAPFTGNIHILPIGILPDYIKQTDTPYSLINKIAAQDILHTRNAFSHKGTYGHALIIAGSYGKMGAAVLSTRAALRTGSGLVTSYIPQCGYDIMQASIPEAMCICDRDESHLTRWEGTLESYKAIGMGPGIGTIEDTRHFLKHFLKQANGPLVLDADALNIISREPALFSDIPENTILTPHPKEFERLFGKSKNAYQRLQLQIEKSRELKVNILLKGHYTCVTTPAGKVFFNTTGNPGMATGGSGDVLTGMITGLLAQGYEPYKAAVLGAWLHGEAGDLAVEKSSQESMIASDIIENIGNAYQDLRMSDV